MVTKMGLLGSIRRTLSEFIKKPEQKSTGLRPGYFRSGVRDDYGLDTTIRKTTPERLGNALKDADEGDTLQQYEIFEEVERDPVVGRVYFKRRLAVTGKELLILPAYDDPAAQKAADFCNEAIIGKDGIDGIPRFGQALFHLTDAIGKAFSAVQVVWKIQDGKWLPVGLESWPQQQFQLGDPSAIYLQDHDQIRVLTSQDQYRGIPIDNFPRGQWVIHVQKNWSQPIARAALFRSVCWYWLFKKFGWKDWAIFLERYGIPPRLAKYSPSAQQNDRDELWTAVKALGKDHACIMPDSTTIELLETKGLSAGAPHPDFIAYCNDQISVAISGNTMSTTQGDRGARSAKEAYQAEEMDQTEFDCKGLAATIREQLVAPLVQINMGSNIPIPRVEFMLSEDEDLYEKAKRDKILYDMKYPIPVRYVSETYGLPLPEEGEDVLPEPTGKTEDIIPNKDKKSTVVQTLILSKKRFKSLKDAKKWVSDHGFKALHKGKPADETKDSYRFRQRDPGDFKDGSFRTIELTSGVKAVIGRLKDAKTSSSVAQNAILMSILGDAVSKKKESMDWAIENMLSPDL